MYLTEDEIKRLEGVVEDLYEDYAYVLSELHDKGIRTVRCYVWCAECEEECEAEVNTVTFEWTCPNCGTVSDQS